MLHSQSSLYVSTRVPLPGQKAPCNQRGLLYQKYSVFMILYNVYPQCERAGRIKVERSWRAGTNTFNKTTEKYGKMPTQSIINVLYYSIRVRHRDEFADCQAGLLSGIIAGCHVVESQRQIRWQWDGRSSPRSLQQAMLCQWQSIECVPSPPRHIWPTSSKMLAGVLVHAHVIKARPLPRENCRTSSPCPSYPNVRHFSPALRPEIL